MKQKILGILMFLLTLASLPTASILAVSESGKAATLAYHVASDSTTDTRVSRLRSFLKSYDSPLAPDAQTFVEQADKYNLD